MSIRLRTAVCTGIVTVFTLSAIPVVNGSPIDGTAFMTKLVAEDIAKSEKECYRTMRKTASCKINIQKVIISKEKEDTANIEIISNIKITAKLLVKAGAIAQVHARATYQMRTCEFNVVDVSKKITELSGAAKYLDPFKDSIKKIEVPTGVQHIKKTETRDKADSYLESQLKLASSKPAEKCENKQAAR